MNDAGPYQREILGGEMEVIQIAGTFVGEEHVGVFEQSLELDIPSG